MFEHVLIGFACAQFLALGPEDRDEVERLIRIIELDPWIDGIH